MAARRQTQTVAHTRLAALRDERGITQRRMAAALGMTDTTYRRLERGKMTNPPLRYLVNAAIALDVELDAVIEDAWREWLVLDAFLAAEPPDRSKLWTRQPKTSRRR